jgi:hypothetical protein
MEELGDLTKLDLGHLWEKRNRLQNWYKELVNGGCGSAAHTTMQAKIAAVEYEIAKRLDFCCPHCRGKLNVDHPPLNYSI